MSIESKLHGALKEIGIGHIRQKGGSPWNKEEILEATKILTTEAMMDHMEGDDLNKYVEDGLDKLSDAWAKAAIIDAKAGEDAASAEAVLEAAGEADTNIALESKTKKVAKGVAKGVGKATWWSSEKIGKITIVIVGIYIVTYVVLWGLPWIAPADMDNHIILYGLLIFVIAIVSIILKKLSSGKTDGSKGLTIGILATIAIISLAWGMNHLKNEPNFENKIKYVLFAITLYLFLRITNIYKLENDHIINRLAFGICILYIIHTLWVILTFTSPTIHTSIKLPEDKQCNLNWLYYGPYPTPNYDKTKQMHTYLFDISTWFPPDITDNPTFTCQPCPSGMTPIQNLTKPNLSCRQCKSNEEWVSFEEIKRRKLNNKQHHLLTDKHLQTIGNNGNITATETESIDASLRTLTNDHPTFFDSGSDFMKHSGMCLKVDTNDYSTNPYPKSGCGSYENCMKHSKGYIDISWPKTSNDVYPGQLFEIKDLEVPLIFKIPENIQKGDCSGDDPKYTPSTYHNKICNDITNGKCHLKIPVDRLSPKNIHTPPEGYKIIRHGGGESGEGPPCAEVNKLTSDYNKLSFKNTLNPSESEINTDGITNKMGRYVKTKTGGDWRNILGMVYDECYEHKGKCHIDDYICKTENNTPLPLVDYSGPTPILTIPEYSLEGCQNFALGCKEEGKPCNSIKIEGEGDIVPTTGECKLAKWVNKKWDTTKTGIKADSHLRCFPKDKENDYAIYGNVLTNPNILNAGKLPRNLCKRIPRKTDSQTGNNQLSFDIYKNSPCSKGKSIPHKKRCSDTPGDHTPCIAYIDKNAIYETGKYTETCCLTGGQKSGTHKAGTQTPGTKKVQVHIDKSWKQGVSGDITYPGYTKFGGDDATYWEDKVKKKP